MSTQKVNRWKKLLAPVAAPLISLVYRAYWLITAPFVNRPGAKRVLFVAHNQMMAKYLSDTAKLIAGDPRVELFVTSPLKGRKVVTPYFDLDKFTYVGYRRSRLQRWDLAVFAEHASVDKYHPDTVRLYTSHGIPSGARTVNGQEYGYGYYATDSNGLPAYAALIEQSELNKRRVAGFAPELAERIAVVGDLRIEALLKLNERRLELRREFGFGDDETVCLFMSSWQDHSLLPTVGKGLIDEAAELASEGVYKFIIASHPNLWSVHSRTNAPWDDYLRSQRERGFTVIEPTEEWEKHLVAADVAIADATSLALTFAILARPVIMVDLPEGIFTPGSLGDHLQLASIPLSGGRGLRGAIDEAHRRASDDALTELSTKIYSYPGEGVIRTRRLLYSLLELEP